MMYCNDLRSPCLLATSAVIATVATCIIYAFAHIFEISCFKIQPYRFYLRNHSESIDIAVMMARLSKTKRK